jgi:flagellar P-ring protein precursor FlgI
VRLTMPANFNGNIVDLLTDVEQLIIEPDLPAKVVIDEATGIIVMGQDVRVSTVAIAQGNLTITVTELPQVSQPAPFSDGQTVVTPQTEVTVNDDTEKKMAIVRNGISLRELVDALNALGVGPRDLISILQAIKAAGALQAEIEVM